MKELIYIDKTDLSSAQNRTNDSKGQEAGGRFFCFTLP